MNNKKLYLAAIIFLIALIVFNKDSSNDWWKVSKTVFNPIIKKLIDKYDLTFCGNGGKMSEDCTYIKFVFQIFRPITMDEAKEILVNSSEEYTQAILSSSKLLSFMPNSEFKLNYLELDFFVSRADGYTIYDPYVCVFNIAEGIAFFSTKAPDERYGYKQRIRIPYEEIKAQVEKMQK